MGSFAERDALSCEGEEWQKITGNIRFRVAAIPRSLPHDRRYSDKDRYLSRRRATATPPKRRTAQPNDTLPDHRDCSACLHPHPDLFPIWRGAQVPLAACRLRYDQFLWFRNLTSIELGNQILFILATFVSLF